MSNPAEINLQWKGTDACYDLYCPCNPNDPQHWDGMFGQWFTCGKSDPGEPDDEPPAVPWCGKVWWLPNRIVAVEVSAIHEWPADDSANHAPTTSS
jgi:hypothetical protein